MAGFLNDNPGAGSRVGREGILPTAFDYHDSSPLASRPSTPPRIPSCLAGGRLPNRCCVGTTTPCPAMDMDMDTECGGSDDGRQSLRPVRLATFY